MIKAHHGEIPNKLTAKSFRGLRRKIILLMNKEKTTFQFEFLHDDDGWHAIYYKRITDQDLLDADKEIE